MSEQKKIEGKYEKPVARDLSSYSAAVGECLAGNTPTPADCVTFGGVADWGCFFGATAQYCTDGSAH